MKVRSSLFFCVFTAFLLFPHHTLVALPAQVLIIRHGNKLTVNPGEHLSLLGRERAAALTPYLMETKELLTYGSPVAIYAKGVSTGDPSLRPIETVSELAEKLKLPLIKNYTVETFQKMVEEIKNNPTYSGKMVLICWDHYHIPGIAEAFGVTNAPKQWSNEVFDRVWMINFNKEGVESFQNLPQRLMYGDSST